MIPKTTEELMDCLSEMGSLSLSRMDDGRWWARLKFPTPKGITAQAESEFQPSYYEALRELAERVFDMQTILADTKHLPRFSR